MYESCAEGVPASRNQESEPAPWLQKAEVALGGGGRQARSSGSRGQVGR